MVVLMLCVISTNIGQKYFGWQKRESNRGPSLVRPMIYYTIVDIGRERDVELFVLIPSLPAENRNKQNFKNIYPHFIL